MNRLLKHVALASAEEHQRVSRHWTDGIESIPRRYRCGGRCGTIRLSLEEFARRFGNPHEMAPREHWRDYNGHPLLDGAGPDGWLSNVLRHLEMIAEAMEREQKAIRSQM